MTLSSRARSLLKQGDRQVAAGEVPGAIAAYSDVLRMDPGNVRALERKGAALLTVGDFAGALECRNELVERQPDNAVRRVDRAQVLAQLQRYEEAIADLDAALQQIGPSSSLLKDKGLFLRRAGRPQEAVRTYRKAIDLNPADADLRAALGDALLDIG